MPSPCQCPAQTTRLRNKAEKRWVLKSSTENWNWKVEKYRWEAVLRSNTEMQYWEAVLRSAECRDAWKAGLTQDMGGCQGNLLSTSHKPKLIENEQKTSETSKCVFLLSQNSFENMRTTVCKNRNEPGRRKEKVGMQLLGSVSSHPAIRDKIFSPPIFGCNLNFITCFQ